MLRASVEYGWARERTTDCLSPLTRSVWLRRWRAAGLAAAIAAQSALCPRAALRGHLLLDPTDAVLDEYFDALPSRLRFRDCGKGAKEDEEERAEPRGKSDAAVAVAEEEAGTPTGMVAYSAMHGMGRVHVERAFDACGLPPPLVAEPAQGGAAVGGERPADGVVEFPHPEEGGAAWAAALQVRAAASMHARRAARRLQPSPHRCGRRPSSPHCPALGEHKSAASRA
jgi:hypothetical protein